MKQREIKFRGYSKDIGRWFYGDLFHAPDNRYFIRMWDEKTLAYIDMLVENKSVGEFTNLKDKNGKEIYGGDIVKKIIKDCQRLVGTFLVKWNNPNVGFDISGTGGHEYEVIGNKFENPKLLEEKR